MSAPDDLDRRNHHRQPRRPDVSHWGKDSSRHDGPDPAACPICHPITEESRA